MTRSNHLFLSALHIAPPARFCLTDRSDLTDANESKQSISFTAHLAALLILFLCGDTVAQEASAFDASGANCPDVFNVVDLGRWTMDAEGLPTFGYGGPLYRVAPTAAKGTRQRDHFRCISPARLDNTEQRLDGLPVPLVYDFTDVDLSFRYIRRASGDYLADLVNVQGYIRQYPSTAQARDAIEHKNRDDFTRWLEGAEARGNVIEDGPSFVCLRRADNPKLEGYGNYSCLLTLDSLPHGDTFFRCAEWGGGCYAEFSIDTGIRIRLMAASLPRWPAGAKARSIPEAVDFWSTLIEASIATFSSHTVPRGQEKFVEVE